MKSISCGFLLLLCLLAVEAGSYHRRQYVDSSLLKKREEDCDLTCHEIENACAVKCGSEGSKMNRELRHVCYQGTCYCGFELQPDSEKK
ncbi:hypothetical protein A0J61_01669 [Choanephora cucurbitarum]|uniref:Uncharacterized protein n=1 Tax=Choanephora cucurbitarum TaxID=101091 RepID=A0A1C7NMA2_9FUNG|nr:hypothetical protein A0J61_01669 [Choanephora cucurbitarum]